MKITVIGSGYVGLVAGTCFAEIGHDVVCVDNDPRKIEALKQGQIPIFEPGLDALVTKNHETGRLNFTADLAEALNGADAAFIAVGTPPRPTDGHADMKYVYAVAREIAEKATGELVVVNKSTVPVGTGDEVEQILLNARRPFKLAVVSNPEFLREGVAIDDFMRPDRVVIGSENDWAKKVVSAIYEVDGLAGANIVHTSRRSAELIKYAANAFLAMKITFINEIADLCEAVGGDIRHVANGVGLDSRIGSKFLNAGPGYGGSCFPKDTLAISKTARDYRVQLRTVETVIQVNDNRKRAMALRVLDACRGSVRGKTIAVLGLAFKADTDDMRDSPAIPVIQALQDFGATIRAYDPEAMENAARIFSNVCFCENPLEASNGADAVVILTEWPEFRNIDLAHLKKSLAAPLVVDLRNLMSAEKLAQAGFEYWSIGSSAQQPSSFPIATAAE
ncbi:MAG: UDP-glucose/GDP-mannose dehydrogenase family protein [Alphaproteobacteria bacterium]|nr:UDP-glucose/GDP-mannose dehydrogenase family protein [Alphaproteobacteria bacterium]MBU1548502.1 UDP-glucose/GDP-mannose dehydrogenase family protein [Alphaproteobacteria bacterium]MBU2337698.1 UDP-glucose/GDP-mannose dehydrogenase family protein [Alphaproteobacteria bacterium]MBU2389835.1 UDP-glucose/GDP-mannose dehydrogenase family protein [Alphaproteobacteria bacterium]